MAKLIYRTENTQEVVICNCEATAIKAGNRMMAKCTAGEINDIPISTSGGYTWAKPIEKCTKEEIRAMLIAKSNSSKAK